jgi:3-hydroxyisobutyrate dehydrogenase-like beta-hydroxyacid dehydrogenase
MTARPRIGFVGLGAMGGNMARRLVSQGFTVMGYDVSAQQAQRSGDAGVKLVGSPAEAADGADIVCSSLPDPATIRRAYLGADGVLSRVRSGAALMDMSTIDPATWREVATAAAAKKIRCIDAPVSGGPKEAGSGGLVFIVGGTPEAVAQCRPVLDALGSSMNHVGPLGSGLIVKLVNNVMSMCNVAFPNVLAGDFTPNFSIALSRKDLGLALDMAAELGVPMLAASVARQVYEAAKASGLNNEDMAAVTKVYEGWADVQVRGTKG